MTVCEWIYAGFAWALLNIAQIVVGSYYFNDCTNVVSDGLYLIIYGGLTLIGWGVYFAFVWWRNTALSSEPIWFDRPSKWIVAICRFYFIALIGWSVVGLITVWGYNRDCVEANSFNQFTQAMSIINLLASVVISYVSNQALTHHE